MFFLLPYKLKSSTIFALNFTIFEKMKRFFFSEIRTQPFHFIQHKIYILLSCCGVRNYTAKEIGCFSKRLIAHHQSASHHHSLL